MSGSNLEIPEEDAQELSRRGYDVSGVIAQSPWPGPLVLQGVCKADGRPCAVKVCRVSTESFPGQFEKECQMLQSLDHQNIVKLFHFYKTRLRAYFVLEFMNGDTLRERLKPLSQPLDQSTALQMINQLADAVHYLHRHGYIHGDLHAGNIMIHFDPPNQTDQARYKLVDFGSAVPLTTNNQTTDIQSLANHLTRILEKSDFDDNNLKVQLKGVFDWMFVGFYKTMEAVVQRLQQIMAPQQ